MACLGTAWELVGTGTCCNGLSSAGAPSRGRKANTGCSASASRLADGIGSTIASPNVVPKTTRVSDATRGQHALQTAPKGHPINQPGRMRASPRDSSRGQPRGARKKRSGAASAIFVGAAALACHITRAGGFSCGRADRERLQLSTVAGTGVSACQAAGTVFLRASFRPLSQPQFLPKLRMPVFLALASPSTQLQVAAVASGTCHPVTAVRVTQPPPLRLSWT